jgi:hypothetical protein
VRIDADARVGELGHIGTPDKHRPRRTQARNDRRVGTGRTLRQHTCAGASHVALHVEQVLDGYRHARQRPDHALLAQHVAGLGLLARRHAHAMREYARALAAWIADTFDA